MLGYTGLRWGEATALRVCDIDFIRRRIDVRRAFSDVGGKIVLGTPKSHLTRTVALPRFLAAELAVSVQGKNPDDLVFTTVTGSVVRSATAIRRTRCCQTGRATITPRGDQACGLA